MRSQRHSDVWIGRDLMWQRTDQRRAERRTGSQPTTVTRLSGRMHFTAALGRKSSSRIFWSSLGSLASCALTLAGAVRTLSEKRDASLRQQTDAPEHVNQSEWLTACRDSTSQSPQTAGLPR